MSSTAEFYRINSIDPRLSSLTKDLQLDDRSSLERMIGFLEVPPGSGRLVEIEHWASGYSQVEPRRLGFFSIWEACLRFRAEMCATALYNRVPLFKAEVTTPFLKACINKGMFRFVLHVVEQETKLCDASLLCNLKCNITDVESDYERMFSHIWRTLKPHEKQLVMMGQKEPIINSLTTAKICCVFFREELFTTRAFRQMLNIPSLAEFPPGVLPLCATYLGTLYRLDQLLGVNVESGQTALGEAIDRAAFGAGKEVFPITQEYFRRTHAIAMLFFLDHGADKNALYNTHSPTNGTIIEFWKKQKVDAESSDRRKVAGWVVGLLCPDEASAPANKRRRTNGSTAS